MNGVIYMTPIDVTVDARTKIVAASGVKVDRIIYPWYRWVDELGNPVSTLRAIKLKVTADTTLYATYR